MIFCFSLSQTEINECESDPCQNGGTCVEGVDEFECVCAAGFEGTLCDTESDECASTPCFNGGSCLNGAARFIVFFVLYIPPCVVFD